MLPAPKYCHTSQPPFGMLIKERSFSSDSYRFGFNSQEKDDEVKGDGNVIAFEARIYDSRLGRFYSHDPLENQYPWQSSYSFAANIPISFLDKEGEGPIIIIGSPEQSKKVKAALEKKDYDEVYRILLYARCNGFVDDNQNSSQFMPNRLLNEKGLAVMANSTLIDGGAFASEGIFIQGVFEDDEGNLEVVDIGMLTDPVGYNLEQSILTNPKAVVKATYEKRQEDLGLVKKPTKIHVEETGRVLFTGTGGLTPGPSKVTTSSRKETYSECVWVPQGNISEISPRTNNQYKDESKAFGYTWNLTYDASIKYRPSTQSDKIWNALQLFSELYDIYDVGRNGPKNSVGPGSELILIDKCKDEDCGN